MDDQATEYPTLKAPSFGQLLRAKREAADLSQSKLAHMTGLRRQTIHNIEQGLTEPAPQTVRILERVAALRLGEPLDQGDPGWTPGAHYAPTYAPLQLAAKMTATLNAPGGSLDQVFLYLDAQSAVDWTDYCNDGYYVRNFRETMPIEDAARRIVGRAGAQGIDVVALGSGDGKSETRLTEHLAELLPQPPDIRLYLLDISHALLHSAYCHAVDTLANMRVSICPIHGDFYDLPRYPVLTYRPAHERRHRVWMFVGNTLGNLVDEPRFFGDLGVCARPGDFAMVHVQLVWAPAQDIEAVRKSDPNLNRSTSPLLHKWLTGPLQRHCRGLSDISVTVDVSNRCAIPGSYEIRFIGSANMHDKSKRSFVLLRSRRYDSKLFADALSDLGWEFVADMPFGPSPPRCSLLLLRRK